MGSEVTQVPKDVDFGTDRATLLERLAFRYRQREELAMLQAQPDLFRSSLSETTSAADQASIAVAPLVILSWRGQAR